MSTPKQSKRNALKSWVDRLKDHGFAQLNLDRLDQTPEAYIEGMTKAQLQFVTACIAGAYSMGSEDTRAFRRSLKEKRYSEALGAFTVKLKAIPGGKI